MAEQKEGNIQLAGTCQCCDSEELFTKTYQLGHFRNAKLFDLCDFCAGSVVLSNAIIYPDQFSTEMVNLHRDLARGVNMIIQKCKTV